ncbi:hypothetical protein BABINDRAFT_181344 [Babjeviella inositovora NRRL Y-12698]|uniref:Vacuolar protein sorting-associated protein 45 n=1 Tax=Babjeviella inositovora NRRL Y-12698 TaxID=984486 RepID=A0A1E3QLU4_9ASCO|nr:uncharacterized protein BABINDRAFT_181344 [Babjeviella inositovora NRRL Y-12698]ODQ77947.1 hypothetical protein BABINDRAFT_181344 [Babjeviella inositovora NRRL Y-12698]
MDLIATANFYVNKLVTSDRGTSIKVLLLDDHTAPSISLCATQSDLLKHEIYLIDKLANTSRAAMRHLRCIVYIKPEPASITALLAELRSPRYASYELNFSNAVRKSDLEKLAESDDLEVVTRVSEVFTDYLVLDRGLFVAGSGTARADAWEKPALDAATQNLSALLLSLKCKPTIRYERNSKMAAKLASELGYAVHEGDLSALFDFPTRDVAPLLLILDRKNDPITPLLVPWTFQSMVHEFIGIRNNTVDLSRVPGVAKDMEQVVLNPETDAFYREAMHLNFGDLGDKIKAYVDQYKAKTNTTKKLDTLQDMKNFIDEFPEFRRLSGNVSKHMTLALELDRCINALRIWEVSELEQSLACNDNHSVDLQELERLVLNHPNPQTPQQVTQPLSVEAKIRLVALYALRYEKHAGNQVRRLEALLLTQGVEGITVGTIRAVLAYAGASQRLETTGEASVFSKANAFMGLGAKQSENLYMQHVPRVEAVVTQAIRGKLAVRDYPVGKHSVELVADRVQDVIVYVVGGITYEEARVLHNLQGTNKGVRIVAGGNIVHNSRTFMQRRHRVKGYRVTIVENPDEKRL